MAVWNCKCYTWNDSKNFKSVKVSVSLSFISCSVAPVVLPTSIQGDSIQNPAWTTSSTHMRHLISAKIDFGWCLKAWRDMDWKTEVYNKREELTGLCKWCIMTSSKTRKHVTHDNWMYKTGETSSAGTTEQLRLSQTANLVLHNHQTGAENDISFTCSYRLDIDS